MIAFSHELEVELKLHRIITEFCRLEKIFFVGVDFPEKMINLSKRLARLIHLTYNINVRDDLNKTGNLKDLTKYVLGLLKTKK